MLAVLSQKDRMETPGKLTVPSLVVHGDVDPLVPLAGGKATADAIPNAELMVVKGRSFSRYRKRFMIQSFSTNTQSNRK